MSNQIRKPLLVAIDDGSGNMAHCFEDTKGVIYDGKAVSCVVPKVLPSLTSGIIETAWETEGKSFTVTRSSAEAVNTCNKDYQLSSANRILVHNTIATAGLNDHPVYLGVTLPTEQFYNRGSDNIINDERIESKKANLLIPSTNISGVYQSPNIVGVKVYPEAIPAYVYCSALPDGTPNPDYPEEHTTLVIDLGRYTCDMAVITTGYSVIDYLTTENGVQKLVDKFKVLLHQNSAALGLHDISAFSSTNIDQIIDLGFIGSTLESTQAIKARKDVSSLVQESKEYLAELVLNDATTLMKGDFSMLTRIVFVGGGANWLKEISQDWYHTVDIPDEPEMAVVRGTHAMLLGSEERIYNELGYELEPQEA
ncbi:TPA: plasmid segregation protein ParM domain-containing protein [Photobacterium damselae]